MQGNRAWRLYYLSLLLSISILLNVLYFSSGWHQIKYSNPLEYFITWVSSLLYLSKKYIDRSNLQQPLSEYTLPRHQVR